MKIEFYYHFKQYIIKIQIQLFIYLFICNTVKNECFSNMVYKAMFLKRAVARRILLGCREDTDLAGKLPENELTDTV